MNDFWKNIKPLPTAQDNNIDDYVSYFDIMEARRIGAIPQRSALDHLRFGPTTSSKSTPKELNSYVTGTSKYKGKTIPEYSGSWDDAYNKARQDFGIHGSKVIMWNGKPMNIESASQKGEWASTTDDPNSYPYIEDPTGAGISREEVAAMDPEYLNRIKKYRAASPEVQAEMEEEERYYSSLAAAQGKAKAAQEEVFGREKNYKPWKFNYNYTGNPNNNNEPDYLPPHIVGQGSDDVASAVWSDISGHDASLYQPDSANVNYNFDFNVPGQHIDKITGDHYGSEKSKKAFEAAQSRGEALIEPGYGYDLRNTTPFRSGKTLEGSWSRSGDQTEGTNVHDLLSRENGYSIPGEYYNVMKENLSSEDFNRWYSDQKNNAVTTAKGLATSVGQNKALNKEGFKYEGLQDLQAKDTKWDAYNNQSVLGKMQDRFMYGIKRPFHAAYSGFMNPLINTFTDADNQVTSDNYIYDDIYGTDTRKKGSFLRADNQVGFGKDNWGDFLAGSIPYHMANSAIELPGGLKDIVTGDDVSGGYGKVGMAALNWIPFMQPLKKVKQLGQFATKTAAKAPNYFKNSLHHAGDFSMSAPFGTTQNFTTGMSNYGKQMANRTSSNLGLSKYKPSDLLDNIPTFYKKTGGESSYIPLPEAQLGSAIKTALKYADDAYKWGIKKPLNKAKDYWNKPMPLDPVTLTQSVPKGYTTAVGEYPGMTQGKYFLHTLNTPTRLAYQSKPVQSLLKSNFAEAVKKPFTGLGTQFKSLGANLKKFEFNPELSEYVVPEYATSREARISKAIRNFGSGIKENEQVLKHGYGKGEREAYEFLKGVEKQANLLSDAQFAGMFKFEKSELAAKVKELAARTANKKAGSLGDQMSEMMYRDLSRIVDDVEAAAIVARTPEEQGLIHAQWNDDIARMEASGATPGELSRARRQEQQLTNLWSRNNIDLSRTPTRVESVDEVLAGLESLTASERRTRLTELSAHHPEFANIESNAKTIDQIINEHYTVVGGRRMRNNRFPDAATATESLRSQGVTEEMVNTIGLETTNPAYLRARANGLQGATSPSGTNASSTSAVLQGNGTQEQVLDYIVDNGVVGNGQFGIRGNPDALADLVSHYNLDMNIIGNHYTTRGRFMPGEIRSAVTGTPPASISTLRSPNVGGGTYPPVVTTKEPISVEGLFVKPLKAVNSLLEKRMDGPIFQRASKDPNTTSLLGTAFAGDGKNIATLYKQAFKRVMDSPKGSRFTGSSSLSDDSWHGTNALAKLAHMKGEVDIVYSGMMQSNDMNFGRLVSTPEFRVRNINRLVKEINETLPKGEKIPFAYIDGIHLKMPRIDVIRKAFGGETVSGPYTMDTYDLSDENIFTPYDKELMDINEMDIEDALGVYKKYMNGGYVGTINEQVAEKVYNLANQKAYVSAKQKGMSPANYIMTNIIG